MKALIGYTGFVGHCLSQQHDFEASYNSRTIGNACGRRFETIVCAAAPGAMFAANRDPERDQSQIEQLMAQLKSIDARQIILISTIAVLSGFSGPDEATQDFERDIPYGVHRRMLEEFAETHFREALIVRLPALFGSGLKKNFLFDILNPMPSMLPTSRAEALVHALRADLGSLARSLYHRDTVLDLDVLDRAALAEAPGRSDLEAATEQAGFSAVQFTNPDSRFQFYDMSRLWSDIGVALSHGLRVLHLVPQPLRAGDVYERFTGRIMPPTAARLHEEDTRTNHASLWGRTDDYVEGHAQTWGRLERFVEAQGRAL